MPSVTELMNWIGYVDLSSIPQRYLEAARARGTAVHAACQLHDQGRLDPSSVDARIEPYVRAWTYFREEKEPHTVLWEERIHHPSGFNGKPDLVAVLNGSLDLLDIKTGVENAPAHAIQLAAYRVLVRDILGLPVERCANLYLRNDGRYRLAYFTEAQLAQGWDRFAAALVVWHARQEMSA